MADPFKERLVTLTITTRTAAHKVAVTESVAQDVLYEFTKFDRASSSWVWNIAHTSGVLSVNLKEVEAINALVPEEARREFVENLVI